MKILQLCCFTNLWPHDYQITSIDLRTGSDVLDQSLDLGKNYDYIVSAPPCDQFTKANSPNWVISPDYFIKVARRCLDISLRSSKPWLLENPPGRIETFLPELTQFRIGTWHGNITNKEYIIYSNHLFMLNYCPRYGKPGSVINKSKRQREMWQPDFVSDILRYI